MNMNMTWVDWAIVLVAMAGLGVVSLYTTRYMKGVADFLSGNRSAGRYLLTISTTMGSTGAISFVAMFEMYTSAGFTAQWWACMSIPVALIIILTGWVYWRFRETRAMTMAQFFEMRYSRRFRVFAGIMCWTSGILNYGIFPAVEARLFIYLCGLPESFQIVGVPLAIPTFPAVMAVLLGISLWLVVKGGQVTIMVTDTVQGIFSNIALLILVGVILLAVPWSQIVVALGSAPAESSMLNPFHTSQVKDFNIWYFLIGMFGAFYGYMSWQGTQGFYSAARNPHEQKMGAIMGVWRYMPIGLATLVIPIFVFAVLRLPEYAVQTAAIQGVLDTIPEKAIRDQMLVPIALRQLLPVGIKGIFVLTMVFFSITTHDTYMHSWGSIFIQDVVLPFRKKALSPEQHIRLLRWSAAFVGVFAFFFSLLYPQTQKILMFFAITGAIWLGGSGAAIIGGLYWKRGTTAGAYTGLITGSLVGLFGLFADQIWRHFVGHDFPINGQWLWFIAMVSAVVGYVLVSLLAGGLRKAANMDKLLHRGAYAVAGEHQERLSVRSRWLQFVGITPEFTLTDRILAIVLVAWNIGWFAAFLIVTAVHFTFGVSTEWWAKFWHFWILLQLVIGVPTTIWFTIGGVVDIRKLFDILKHAVRDARDDGRVLDEPASASSGEGDASASAAPAGPADPGPEV